MLRRQLAVLAAALAGVALAVGVAACGEDRGSVSIEGGTTGGGTVATATSTTPTTPTTTTPTTTAP